MWGDCMAVAYLTYEQFVDNLKHGFLYTISYSGEKYSIGKRFIVESPYYILNHQNLDMKMYYSLNDLFIAMKEKKLSLKEIWDDVIILKLQNRLDFNEEVKIIQDYAKGNR